MKFLKMLFVIQLLTLAACGSTDGRDGCELICDHRWPDDDKQYERCVTDVCGLDSE